MLAWASYHVYRAWLMQSDLYSICLIDYVGWQLQDEHSSMQYLHHICVQNLMRMAGSSICVNRIHIIERALLSIFDRVRSNMILYMFAIIDLNQNDALRLLRRP